MAKVYMVRHQKGGILTDYVFQSTPTAEQQAPIVAECERLHGKGGWVRIHEAELLSSEVPKYPERRARGTANVAAVAPFKVEGVGRVVNPGEEMTIGPGDVGEINVEELLGKKK